MAMAVLFRRCRPKTPFCYWATQVVLYRLPMRSVMNVGVENIAKVYITHKRLVTKSEVMLFRISPMKATECNDDGDVPFY